MKWFESLKSLEDLEYYLMFVLFIFTLWFIYSTVKYYKGEKRKVKQLHRFAREGESTSQYELAKRYAKGQAVRKSKHNAASFSQKAAFSGDKDAKKFHDKIMKKKSESKGNL